MLTRHSTKRLDPSGSSHETHPGLFSFPTDSHRGKRNSSGPRSVHASRSFLFSHCDHTDCSNSGVLFPGSCRPDCILSHHPAIAMRRCRPHWEFSERAREEQCFMLTLQSAHSGEGDRQVTQSLATPAGSVPPAWLTVSCRLLLQRQPPG